VKKEGRSTIITLTIERHVERQNESFK